MPDGTPAPSAEVFPLRGARVYVAGHRGMVGAACARHLAQQGVEVITSDRATVDLRRQDRGRGLHGQGASPMR